MDRERVAKRLRGSGYIDVDALSSDADWVEVADLAIEATGTGRLESIVRDLATCDPPSFDLGGVPMCGLCNGLLDAPRAQQHAESCPWRRAVEWADADGGDDGGP